MAYICLLLSGAALLVNGLTLLGRVPGRDSGVFNVLVGGLQLVLCTAVAVTADGSLPALLAIAGTFLFGLTYLYVGLDALTGLGSAGLGWFCGLVAGVAGPRQPDDHHRPGAARAVRELADRARLDRCGSPRRRRRLRRGRRPGAPPPPVGVRVRPSADR
ncbi:AmiS/UreI family transporter, partial [Curtobacterium sp. Csp1]|uniref:AmiS/UreI family transporter n=1 Tax=Curtobacterium sp. Csp1 TaxID=2495429 RepID=UPI0034A0C0D6